ncbi:MAG: PAS domain S-box protein [Acidobacteriota bacterium]
MRLNEDLVDISAPSSINKGASPDHEKIFQQLFEFAPDGIVVVDKNGLINQVNARAEQMFGFSRHELIGQPVECLIPERFSNRHINQRNQYLGAPHVRPMGEALDLYAQRKDGSEFPVDISLSPIESENGRMILAAVRDITEHKFVEAQAREAQEIFSRLFEFAPDAIIVIGKNGCITRANAQTEEMFGFTRNELINQPIEILIPDRFTAKHIGHRSGFLNAPLTRTMGAGLELYGKRKDGTEFPVDVMLSPVQMEFDRVVLAVVRDITERKTAELKVQEAMRREMHLKEVHQKELHHRIKNNLQVISSLLYLQSAYVNDTATLEILRESQTRVKSIALIHEKLYRSDNIEKLDFAGYVRDLLVDIFRTYSGLHEGLAVHTDLETIHLGIDTAIPLGLIINELISNALKHAFPNNQPGEIWVDLHPLGDKQFSLSISDNGVGLPANLDWKKTRSLGLKLVMDLTKQLEGKIEVFNQPKTRFQITFGELQYKERG